MRRTARAVVLASLVAASPAFAVGQAPAPPAAGTPPDAEFEALRRQAEEARAAGRLEAAVAAYARAIELQPSWAEGRWYLGTIYYDADRHRECADAFASVVRLEPKHAAAWAFRGLCEFRIGEYDAALAHLTNANRLGLGDDPDFVAVVGYHRSILLARFEQFERALDIQQALVRGGNTGPDMLQALGIAMLRLPRVPSEVPPGQREMVELAGRATAYAMALMKEPAEQAFADLIAKYADAPNVHYAYGSYLLAERPAEALEHFKMELARSPHHVPARVQIAEELIKQGDFDAATPYAVEAARLAPNNFIARKVSGQVKLQARDVAGAISELEAARTLEPSSPSVRFQLARAYQRAGRTADAERERGEFRRLERLQQLQRGAADSASEPAAEDMPHR